MDREAVTYFFKDITGPGDGNWPGARETWQGRMPSAEEKHYLTQYG